MPDQALIDIGSAIAAVVLGAALCGLLWFFADVLRPEGSATRLSTGACPRCGGTGHKLGPPQETWTPCPRCNGSGRR